MLAKLMEGRKYDCFLVDSVPSFRFLFFPLVGMRKLMCFLFETRGMSSLIESFLARKQTWKKKEVASYTSLSLSCLPSSSFIHLVNVNLTDFAITSPP